MRPLHLNWRWLAWLAVTAPLAAGLGLGVLLEHWRCSGRQAELLGQLVQRLAQIEAELRQLRAKLAKQRRQQRVRSSASYRDLPGGSSSDEFFDAESDGVGGAAPGAESAVMFGLEAASATTPELRDLLLRVDGMLASGEEAAHREAYELLRESFKRDRGLANQAPVLLRWAQACLRLHFAVAAAGDSGAATDLLGQADAASAQALELDTGSADCHAVRARALGLTIRDRGVKEKVTGGIKFRQLVERGLELDPDHADLLELKACFLYEVSRVGWLERKTATYLFGPDCLPPARLEDARRLIDRAVALRPASVSALYWAARCRLDSGAPEDVAEAVRLLRRATGASAGGVEDRRLQAEADRLLAAYA